MLVTVFTPTYNRAYCLPALYESLQRQTCKNFEWLIIDDGSSDNTDELAKEWIKEDSFSIRYIKQINGGKHRAVNKGVSLAKGEFFFIVDSDDLLACDCVEQVCRYGSEVIDDSMYAGVVGMKIYPNGKRVGGDAKFNTLKCSRFDFRYKYKYAGDLAEVYKTEVMKEYPFPEYSGEKFCPEAYVWVAIAMKYKLLFFNKGIYICEYLEDGLTKHIDRIRINSPKASMETYAIEFNAPVPFSVKLKDAINYWRFRFHNGNKDTHALIALWALPLGWVFFKRDCIKYEL